MFGVAPIDFDINSATHNCGWYYYCANSTICSGTAFNKFCNETNLCNIEEEIIIVMNINKRTLKFK